MLHKTGSSHTIEHVLPVLLVWNPTVTQCLVPWWSFSRSTVKMHRRARNPAHPVIVLMQQLLLCVSVNVRDGTGPTVLRWRDDKVARCRRGHVTISNDGSSGSKTKEREVGTTVSTGRCLLIIFCTPLSCKWQRGGE